MAVYGTNCLKFEGAEPDDQSREWLARELHIVQPKLVVCMGEDALGFLNGLDFPLSQEVEPKIGRAPVASRRRSTRSSRPTSTRRSTSSRSKTAFWNAFKPVGAWWAELPPY